MTDDKLALQVIEAICEHECLKHVNLNDYEALKRTHKNCFPCKVYTIAHSANPKCRPNHSKWWPDTKKLHKELSR